MLDLAEGREDSLEKSETRKRARSPNKYRLQAEEEVYTPFTVTSACSLGTVNSV